MKYFSKWMLHTHLAQVAQFYDASIAQVHADHIKSVGNIGEKCNIPIYSTKLVHQGIRKSYCVTQELSAINIRYIEKDKTIDVEDFHITAFEVPHDGTDNVGYHIQIDGKVFCFLTDLGEITPTVQEHIEQANYLIIEANYDRDMPLYNDKSTVCCCRMLHT